MSKLQFILVLLILSSCVKSKDPSQVNFPRETIYQSNLPDKENLWIFMMAGQSNMAGRGFVEPQDTIPNQRILTIDKSCDWIQAKEPIHFYEPSMAGLDCGMSFAKTLLDSIPDNVSIALIPCAVGGSSIEQWLHDSDHRGVKLLSNFNDKAKFAGKFGIIKGILWLQGETDGDRGNIDGYNLKLDTLFSEFKSRIDEPNIPIIMGELGSYSEHPKEWKMINDEINKYALDHENVSVVTTSDLVERGDHLHFNSESQRELGRRYAKAFLELYD